MKILVIPCKTDSFIIYDAKYHCAKDGIEVESNKETFERIQELKKELRELEKQLLERIKK